MISFGAKYWLILLLAFVIAALGLALLLYLKNTDNKELTNNQVRLLMVLRFVSFFLIAFFLLSPFVRNLKKIVQNPVIITAWDNSGSVVVNGDSSKIAFAVQEIKQNVTAELKKNNSILNYTFGQTTEMNGELDFSEKKSDYSQIISTLSNNHMNEYVGAVIIAGDGIFNQGKNPVNMIDNVTFPVYTIGLGDTTEVSDARIQNVRVNRTSFSGNLFPVEIDLLFSRLAGRSLRLSVFRDEEKIDETVITPPTNDYFHSQEFVFESGEPGLTHYTAAIEVAEDERNTNNNTAGFVVNVLENKQKVLILSNGPHPDNGAIKNTLEQQKSYEVSIFTGEPYPSNLSDFNLIILHQLPSQRKSMANIFAENKNRRVPLLFIMGNQTFIPQLNTLSLGVEIEPLSGSQEEAQADINPAYATFTLSEELRELVPRFPPLLTTQANYRLAPEFSPVLYQKIKNILTSKPLMATGIKNGRKTGFIFGEGIWRWRLHNYYLNQTHNSFNELINQLVQYLSLRENEDNFLIDFQPVYAEIDDVMLKAEVYNEAYEQITSEEVTIEIIHETGEELHLTFDITGNSYSLNAGKLPVGNYDFSSEVSIGNETYTEKGSFTVTPLKLEHIMTRANHKMMYQLSAQSGGNFYLPNQTRELVNDIQNSRQLKPVSYFREIVSEFLNLRWLFFVILLLLSMEWFLRKYWGIY